MNRRPVKLKDGADDTFNCQAETRKGDRCPRPPRKRAKMTIMGRVVETFLCKNHSEAPNVYYKVGMVNATKNGRNR